MTTGEYYRPFPWESNECDCLVASHRGEGMGLVHAEAMAAGNPVISTASGEVARSLWIKTTVFKSLIL